MLKSSNVGTSKSSQAKQTIAQHLTYQHACKQREYHSWSDQSCKEKMEYLCIFHDQIGGRTSKPQIIDQTKVNSVSGQIPIFVIRMLTHGHKEYVYAHYDITIWLGNAKYNSSSICRALCALERYNVKGSGVLFPKKLNDSCLDHCCWDYLGYVPTLDPTATQKDNSLSATDPKNLLPNNLFLQLDKFAKDNKTTLHDGILNTANRKPHI
jgi:hypothetical protein